jgi:phospholipid-binding lipoprotein MlaA
MKSYFLLIVLFIFLAAGYAQGSDPVSIPARTSEPANSASSPPVLLTSGAGEIPAKSPAKAAPLENDEYKDDENLDYAGDAFKEERLEIADPLEPFNRAMYHFNDKLYFWMLKPVAQGYKEVVPESARVSVNNFFSNLGFPIRFLSCLLQADFSGAATEAGRFGVNTIWGIGGLMDPAASKELDLQKQETDLGQTLGVYGVGHGFYIVWPVWGPSSPRDSLEIAGVYFLHPVSYIPPWYASVGVASYAIVNRTSLRIGDYESLKGAAIDPYVSMRDAYIQYRMNRVKARRAKAQLSKDGNANKSSSDLSLPGK